MDVIKTRFEVQSNQIIDISAESGEPVYDLASLPDETTVLISIGKAGNVQDTVHRIRANGFGRRYQIMKEFQAEQARMAQLERLHRGRFSSDGSVEQFVDGPDRYGRRNSFELDRSNETQPELSTASPSSAVLAELKFQELWRLSFPSMGCISRADLLQIENPMILTDLMLGLSSLSCGTLSVPDFEDRLLELGYSDADREFVIGMLERAIHTKK
ncbi:hypothetical protein P43SY_010681 [Pythium insidiosum]|uniref:Uncharacterized protein n=1 Tax=Pythium insidiosum TaxID=114742 RepID=A0AAD5Q4G2_PYTIN|nr:hypothetical protein P43SY_010681 [Pythium insidiosum]